MKKKKKSHRGKGETGRNLEPQMSGLAGGSNSSKSNLATLRAEDTNIPWQHKGWESNSEVVRPLVEY